MMRRYYVFFITFIAVCMVVKYVVFSFILLQARMDIERILDTTATTKMQDEVRTLLKTVTDSAEEVEVTSAKQRLFELFLQRDDMRRFSSDFTQIEAFL